MARLPSGGMFLEFPTLTNRTYTVEYSSRHLVFELAGGAAAHGDAGKLHGLD